MHTYSPKRKRTLEMEMSFAKGQRVTKRGVIVLTTEYVP